MNMNLRGIDIIGARTRQTLVGVASTWDNSQSYPTGSYCYNGGRYYRALRDVTPPFLPSFQAGDVPGASDAWREVSASEATDNKNVIGGSGSANITDWDKTLAYDAGAVVRYYGQWYKANRTVDSASILWGNDAPDKSDAWRNLTGPEVAQILSAP